MRELARVLSRGILKAARRLERNGVALSLVFCRPAILYDMERRKKFGLRRNTDNAITVALSKIGNGAEYLYPGLIPERRISQVIAEELRCGSIGTGIDQGLEALRYIHEIVALAESFEIVPKASEAHKLPSKSIEKLRVVDDKKIRAGDILIAHPWSCLSQQEYHQSVLLVCDVRSDGAVLGLVLNRATASGVFHGGSCPSPDGTLLALGKCSNDNETKKNDQDTLNRIFYREELVFCVDESQFKSLGDRLSESKRFHGYASWEPQQLETELSRGVWLQCRAPSHHIVAIALAGAGGQQQFSSSSQAEDFDQLFWQSALTAATRHPELADYTAMDQEHARYYLENILRRHYRDLHSAMRPNVERQDASSFSSSSSSTSRPGSSFSQSQNPAPSDEEGDTSNF